MDSKKKQPVNLKKPCLMDQTLSLLVKNRTDNQQFTSAETTDTINSLIRHVREDCSKCPKDSVYLIIGAYYFELFKSRLNKFKNLAIDRDFNSVNNKPKDKEKDKNWDNIKMKNCDTYSELINLDSQKKILEYLFKAIDIWKKLLDVKERLKLDIMDQLDIFEILKSCFFVFSFYGATKYIKLTSTIYLELVLLHGQTFKNHLLFAYYCQIRFCLDYGLMDKAQNYLKTCNSLIKNVPKSKFKYLNVEIYLIKILECELKLLLNQEIEQAVSDLKELLNQEYFKTITVVSGYIKSLAHFLCLKFSAKVFPDQDLYEFFNEPFVFSRSLFTKWYPFLCETTPDLKQININSSTWIEFAAAKFIAEFSLTYYYRSVNCSVVDVHFFFNILVARLSRIYCSLLWLSRILLLSIYYEKNEVQKVKLNQVKNLFVRKKCDLKKINKQTQNQIIVKKAVSNTTNISTGVENEPVNLQDDSLDMRNKEYAYCSHQEDTPIHVLKMSMLKNPIFNHDEIEELSNFDYEKELADLDDYFIPDLIVVKQELLFLLYLINESKPSFISYFKQIDLDVLNAIYFENLSNLLNVDFETLNRNHQNLIISQFNMRCLLIYLENVDLDNSSTIDLTKNVLKKVDNLGHTYEIHCFIADLVLHYIESLLKEISPSKLNILEYDFFECEKYLMRPVLFNSPDRKRAISKLKIKPNAPKKICNYKMDEIKDYIQEMYNLEDRIPKKKNSVKLNFTDSDEEECDLEKDKETLKLKISKLKAKKNSQENEEFFKNNKITVGKPSKPSKNEQSTLKDKKTRSNILFNNNSKDSTDLNVFSSRIVNLCLDDTFGQEDRIHEYLIDESSDNYYIEFRKLLNNVLDLFGGYPSIKHYNSITTLLFRLSICEESTFGDEAAYYLSEVCQGNALRYKTVQHLKKKCKNVPIKYDTKILNFKPIGQIVSKNDELNKLLEILPRNWRIVQIQFLKGNNSKSDLYLARYQRDVNPIILKISVNSEKLSENFTKEFNEIIQLSNDTVKEKDSKNFWKLRYALDDRLKRLLIDVNSTWINCFIGLFLGECLDSNCKKTFKEIEYYLMAYAKMNNLTCLNQDLLKVISESLIFLNEESFSHAMITLFEPKNRFEGAFDQCLKIVKKYLKFNTLEELKENITKKIKFGPLGLITGPTLENFPFESLFSLRVLNSEIFRVPSIRFLNWMYANLRKTNQRIKQGVSDKDVYYLINPSNNLSYTEGFFKLKFEGLRNKENCNWDGLIGEIPNQNDLKKALEKKDIYIYFGHNSGVRYLGKLHECNVNCLSMVIGCSSAALSNQDQMVESFGSSYYFLINGCPTYIGCLWNVTDRDIDKFAERLLLHTFKVYDQEENIEKCTSITKAVALSRNICKLKYLNGSAPVIRGLPISMRD